MSCWGSWPQHLRAISGSVVPIQSRAMLISMTLLYYHQTPCSCLWSGLPPEAWSHVNTAVPRRADPSLAKVLERTGPVPQGRDEPPPNLGELALSLAHQRMSHQQCPGHGELVLPLAGELVPHISGTPYCNMGGGVGVWPWHHSPLMKTFDRDTGRERFILF